MATTVREVLLIFGVIALLLSPSLCLAGFIAHPCDCPEGQICSHEAKCSMDPCADGALRESGNSRLVVTPALFVAPDFALSVEFEPNWQRSRERSASIGSTIRRSPGSELPLLI